MRMPADLPDEAPPRPKPGPPWLKTGWRNVLAMLKVQAEAPRAR